MDRVLVVANFNFSEGCCLWCGGLYIITSAKTGTGIRWSISRFVSNVYERVDPKLSGGSYKNCDCSNFGQNHSHALTSKDMGLLSAA